MARSIHQMSIGFFSGDLIVFRGFRAATGGTAGITDGDNGVEVGCLLSGAWIGNWILAACLTFWSGGRGIAAARSTRTVSVLSSLGCDIERNVQPQVTLSRTAALSPHKVEVARRSAHHSRQQVVPARSDNF